MLFQKISVPLPRKVFSIEPPTPPEIPFQCHTLLEKFGLLKPPSPVEFPVNLPWGGMDTFWNYTLQWFQPANFFCHSFFNAPYTCSCVRFSFFIPFLSLEVVILFGQHTLNMHRAFIFKFNFVFSTNQICHMFWLGVCELRTYS